MRIVVTLVCLLPALGWADDSRPAPAKPTGYVEAGLGRARLSGDLSSWQDIYIKGHVQVSSSDGIFGEVSNQRHFDDRGNFIGAGWTHTFDPDWYGTLSLGTSDGGFFLPRLRIDAALFHKWLPRRNLVTGLTLGYYRAKDVHYDHNLLINAVYYFDGPWIAEGGVRINRSQPGSVIAKRAYAAGTYGRVKERYLTLHHESGREAYQLVATDTAVANFASHETTLTWREWLTKDAGFNLTAARYVNSIYQRTSVSAGVFYDF